MRYLAIALGLCFVSGFLSSPLAAAVRHSGHSTDLVPVAKHKAKKIKPHKAPKHHAFRAN